MFARFTLTIAALLLFQGSPAQAVLVTQTVGGSVTNIMIGSAPSGTVGGIDLGDAYIGTFAYETTNAGSDQDTTTSSQGIYIFGSTTTNTVDLNIDGNTFDTPIGSVAGVTTLDNVTSALSTTTDILQISKQTPNLPAGWTVVSGFSSAGIFFVDSTGTALPSDALPTSFNLNDWETVVMRLTFSGDVMTPAGTFNNVLIESTIDLTAVPEPSALIMLAFVSIGGLARRRRRRA